MRIVTVVGNRPQFVKAAAVSRHLREQAEEVLVHTGQHYDRELSALLFEELRVPAPDYLLGVGPGTHAEQTARTMTRLEPLVAELEPDGVLVYGDTNATLAAALVAAKTGVPLAHVEAGMRSFDLSMPEEVNRIVADRFSDLLLCSTPTAVRNLEREGIVDGVRTVGDVMADVAIAFGPVAQRCSTALEQFGLSERSYLLATAHRPENVDRRERLNRLVDVLLAAAHDAPVVFAAHPRTAARLEEAGVGVELARGHVILTPPLGYLDLTRLLHGARALLTDSGGLQKEAYLAGVPCVTLRPSTEWVETVESGWNVLVDLDADAAVHALRQLRRLRDSAAPDAAIYGGGRAGERVVDELTRWARSGQGG